MYNNILKIRCLFISNREKALQEGIPYKITHQLLSKHEEEKSWFEKVINKIPNTEYFFVCFWQRSFIQRNQSTYVYSNIRLI